MIRALKILLLFVCWVFCVSVCVPFFFSLFFFYFSLFHVFGMLLPSVSARSGFSCFCGGRRCICLCCVVFCRLSAANYLGLSMYGEIAKNKKMGFVPVTLVLFKFHFFFFFFALPASPVSPSRTQSFPEYLGKRASGWCGFETCREEVWCWTRKRELC